MKLLLVFSVLLLAGSLEAERCIPKKCPANEVWSCCPPCPQRYCTPKQIRCPAVCRPACTCQTGFVRDDASGKCIREKMCFVTKPPHCSSNPSDTQRSNGMNWAIIVLFAAGCGICVAQTTTTSKPPGTTQPSKPEPKGLIPLTAGAKCPIRTCRRNEVLRTCGLCYDNTCSGQAIAKCQKICYCGCYCKVGYIRTTTDGPCVLPKQCPILPIG
ncbi:zonadhesin-like [Anopheles marshallii]|uniref:zonadhesin-like n=1 Tax=Anopheles marshallii TaxID=1521116 RepID=UPI00237C05B4|nr:zonadhesin-like [Anopheles marshallii]